MKAHVGDQVVVESRTDAQHKRQGEVVEVRGEEGGPPYLVRWEDGHEGLVFPGPDAHVVPQQQS